MAYPLQSSSRYQSVTLDAGDTVIDLGTGGGISPFPVIEAGDLTVIRVRGEVEEPLTLDADYALGNLNQLPGPRIFLAQPAQQDDRIIAIGARPIRRPTDLYDGQRFNDVTLNSEFDNLTIQQQELRRDADRAWKSDYGIPGGRIEVLPAGNFWRSDGDGNMVDGGSAADIAAAQDYAAAAQAAREAAEAAQAAAEEAADSLGLPSIGPEDANKVLVVNADGTGYDLTTPGTDAVDISYDGASSGLGAENAQQAFDEIAGRDVIRVADRAALKALNGLKTPVAIIHAEGGRNGTFVFSPADLSAEVAADDLEGIYVAPDSDDTGASGAWVRLVGNAYDLRWWGTVGDGVTDDAPAIQAAIDTVLALGGGTLIGPIGAHLCESTITISGRLTLQGATAAIPAVAESSPDNECFTLLFDLANGVDGLVVADAAARIDGASVEDVFIKRSTLEVIAGGGFGGGRGLKVLGVVNPRFENVHIHNFAIDLEVSDIASGPTSGGSFNGVRCSTAARIQLLVRGAIDVCFNDCIFGGREGGNIYNAALAWSNNTRRPNACHFTNCMFIESGGTRPTNNLRIVNGFWNTFQNCVFERAGDHSIRVTYDSALSPSIMGAIFDGCHTNDPGLACILVDAEVSNVQLLNCRLHQGNTAVSPNTCVRFEHAAAAQASHRIAGNTIRFDGYGGVRVNNAGGVIVSQNRILGSGTGTGVVLQSGASKCIVSENVFSGISTDVGDAGTSNIKPNNQTI